MAITAFRDRVAWVTGATSGIGRALAGELGKGGARVVISGRRRDRLDEVAGAVRAAGGSALVLPCDVTDEASVEGAADEIAKREGRLDLAIANAGFSVGGSFEKIGADAWRRQFDTNVIGAAMTIRHALPELRDAGGRAVLVGSVSGMIPAPKSAPYAASKAALRALGQALAAELAATGVSVTTVHPGFVESEIAKVDNRGVFDEDRSDRRPALLMWPAGRAARSILRAAARRKREHVFTGHGKIAGFLGRHAPALAHLAAARSGR